MRIVIVNKSKLQLFPPTINIINCLIKNNVDVVVICTSCSKKLESELKEYGVKILKTSEKELTSTKLEKIKTWLTFRNRAWKYLKKEKYIDYLWIATADTALCMGKSIFKYKYFFSILELYDKNKIYRKGLKKYAINAQKIIVPEYCRGQIFKVWWELKKNPIVLPNKPYSIQENEISEEIQAVIEKHDIGKEKDVRYILYQGHINKDRDITVIVKALKEINNINYKILLMGKDYDNTLEYLKNIYSEIIYIPFIEAPYHLHITKKAHIGITTYDDSSLNHIFCAPNKIYEYTKYGIPVLARDIPGLRYTIGVSKAGVCIDTNNVVEVKLAIEKLINNYEYYSENASNFFDMVNTNNIVKSIIEK